MKRLTAICVILFYSISVFAQAQDGWYRVYQGRVGNLDATLHLTKAGKNYGGYLWFSTNQWPMPVQSGNPVAKTDSIQVSAGTGPLAVVITGILSETSFAGTSQFYKDGNPGKQGVCQLQISPDKSFSSLKYLFAEGNAKLPPQYKNESECVYFFGSVWPTGNNSFDETLKKHLRPMLGMKNPATETGKWLQDQKTLALNTWKKENGKLSPKETADMGLSLSVEQTDQVMVMFENSQLITLAHYSYVFSGGAHGNYSTSLVSIDKKTGKQLLIQDVLNPSGLKAMPAILDRVARLQYGIKNNGSLTQNGFQVDRIDPSKQIFVTGSGIGFLYAPYEIKSFADGEVSLMVPFKALGPYLQPAFQQAAK